MVRHESCHWCLVVDFVLGMNEWGILDSVDIPGGLADILNMHMFVVNI